MRKTFLFLCLALSGSWLLAQSIEKTGTATVLSLEGVPVLTYVHAETPAPEGVDPAFKRSAYIHPMRSPGGEVLTRIQPTDHYHHYGIWNPWTRTRIGDRGVDFWNLAMKQGTVKFAGYLDKVEEPGRAGFRVKHDHVYFLDDGSEEVAIQEIWELSIQKDQDKRYIADLTTTLSSPVDGGILLEAYRYGGGLGYRATEKWSTDNSTVLTSEGKTRADADGTGARWVIIEGESSVSDGRSGILFLSHPSNRAHPEPMRMWPPDTEDGIGNVFFEFCPIRHQEWKLEQNQAYTLKYRMVVFDGDMDPKDAEAYWNHFAGKKQ